jgi:carbamoylphosphate synthase large subunit
MKRHIVLLGSAGTGTAFAAACALRRVWSQSVSIVAMDINPRHLVTTSLLADASEQVPLSASPEFPGGLNHILLRYSVDTYVPFLPEEIALAARMRDAGQIAATVTVMAPPVGASEMCANKWHLCEFLSSAGIVVPKTSLASKPFAAEEAFLKPIGGTGSHGARKVKIEEIATVVGRDEENWIVQEVCSKPEVTVDAFYDPSSEFSYVICRERIETKSGVSTKCRLFSDETLAGYARKIAVALGLKGSYCFQVMHTSAGWAVTDINPRPGAATAMCAATGNDFFAASFALHWGEDFQQFFHALEGEYYVTRQYAEFLMGGEQ